MTSSIRIVNQFLNQLRIPKEEFDDLITISDETAPLSEVRRTRIFRWFRFLQSIEIKGWRTKATTRSIVKILTGNEVFLYALFCPSYKKGLRRFGFRTDGVGRTTISGLENLQVVHQKTAELGFDVGPPLAIFFDLALEQPDKTLHPKELIHLEKNIANLKKLLPHGVEFAKLSKLSPQLFRQIGYEGIKLSPLPIPEEVFQRILERGRKFYQLFGWTEEQIVERSKVIASSEALVGRMLRKMYPTGILVYTPTMLERGAVYSGLEINTHPHPIIYPSKEPAAGL